MSERLRRWIRNPSGSARSGSNPLGVALCALPQKTNHLICFRICVCYVLLHKTAVANTKHGVTWIANRMPGEKCSHPSNHLHQGLNYSAKRLTTHLKPKRLASRAKYNFKTKRTPCGTRTRNLRIRSPTPCPLGQGGRCSSANLKTLF